MTPQSGNRVSTSLGNSGLCWTIFAWNSDTAVPAEGNGDLQTLICVPVARPRRCPTLSNPVPWQNWMAAYLGYTLWMKMLFRGWPVMVHDTHTRRRRIHGSVRPLQIWPQPEPRPRGSGLGLSLKHLASFDIPGLQQQPVRSTENRQNWIAR